MHKFPLRGQLLFIAVSGSDVFYDIRNKINLSIFAHTMISFHTDINIKEIEKY